MNRITSVLAVAALALAGTFAYAQMTPPPGGMDRGKMHEGMKAAYESCKDKPDRRGCMAEQMCAKAPDPTQCRARAKEHGQRMHERADRSQMMHEACNGKRGQELTSCIKGQHEQLHAQRMEERQKMHEACNGKRGDDLGKCMHEQREKSGHHMHGQKG